MTSNYKRLGDYIRQVDVRNKDLKVDRLLGVSMSKVFMPSIANTIGTDMSNYKVVRNGQFAYGPVTSRNGDKVSVALLEDGEDAIISQAYTVFEIIDSEQLSADYLMMWFRRPEFDRYARFHSHGSAREVFDWDEICDVMLPVPSISRQRELVAQYESLSRRIRINEQMIATLEDTAQTLYRKMFVEGIDKENLPEGWRIGTLGEVCSKLGSGATPKGGKDSYTNSGVSLIRSMNVYDYKFITYDLAHITDVQAKALDSVTVSKEDVLFNITGVSVARCCMVPKQILPARVNQHVMIVRAKEPNYAYYLLFCLCAEEQKTKLLGMSMSGSTREAITKGDMENFGILIPSNDTVSIFYKKAKTVMEHKDLLTRELSTLRSLQSLLLTKLSNA